MQPTISENESLSPECRRELEAILARIAEGTTDGIAELSELSAKVPGSSEVLGHLAGAHGNRGQYGLAAAVYQRYLEIHPGEVQARWRLADRLVNLGKLDEAEALYRAVLADAPDCEDAKMGVRYVLFRKRRDARAGSDRKNWMPGVQRLTRLQRRNKRLNDREFDRQRIRLKSNPSQLYLESTTKCNFFCKTCTKGYEAYHAEDLQAGIKRKVVRELMPTNSRISITGFGEPTLGSDFDGILRMSVENGSKVHFVTNASLLNFERIEQLMRTPVEIYISCDGATRETFEAVRDGSNFDLFLEKLAMIKKLRDIFLAESTSRFTFNFVALRRNIDELEGVVRLAHRYGIVGVGASDYSLNYNEFDEQSLRYEPERANRAMRRAHKVAKELGVPLFTPPEFGSLPQTRKEDTTWSKLLKSRRILPARNRFPRRCNSPWKEPYIHTDGVVVPCCTSRQYLGDLKKQSFAEIWNGWRYRLLRYRIHSVMPPLPCRRCFLDYGINGGNTGNVLAKEGLIIKGLYWLEIRLQHFAGRIVSWKQRRDGEQMPAPEPNYYKGRPITDRNRPPTQGTP